MKVIDTFAWFEYLFGREKGKRIDELIRTEEIGTAAVSLTEIIRKLKREGKSYFKEIEFITLTSKILPVTKEVAMRAGEIRELHFSDALILATSLENNSTLVTGDEDFRNISGVEML